jgi:hypothetical protein
MTFIPGVYNVPVEAPVRTTQSEAGPSVPVEAPVRTTQSEAGPSVPASATGRTGTLTAADLGVNAEEAHLVGKGGCMGSGKSAGVPSQIYEDSDDDADDEPAVLPDPDDDDEPHLPPGDAEEQPGNEDEQPEARIPTGDAVVDDRYADVVDYESEPDVVPPDESNPPYVNPPLSQGTAEQGTDSLGFGLTSPTVHEQETPLAEPEREIDQAGPPKKMQVPLALRPGDEVVVRVQKPTQEPAVSIERHLPPAAVGGQPTADELASSNPSAKSKLTGRSIAFVTQGVKGATRMIGPDENPLGKTRAAKRSKTDGAAQDSSLLGNVSLDSLAVQEGEESSGKGKRKAVSKKTSSKKGTSKELVMSPKNVDSPDDVLSPPRASKREPRSKKHKGGGQ